MDHGESPRAYSYIQMHTTILAAFFEITRTPLSMCSAGIVIFLIALWAARTDVAQASGLDNIAALSNLCFAIPLAVFGALHLSAIEFVLPIVPSYMPWRLFWAYLVGFALLSASLSIATKIQVRWSALLFGLMMFLFVATIHFPGALQQPHNRILWPIVFRALSSGRGGSLLAVTPPTRCPPPPKTTLITSAHLSTAIPPF